MIFQVRKVCEVHHLNHNTGVNDMDLGMCHYCQIFYMCNAVRTMTDLLRMRVCDVVTWI